MMSAQSGRPFSGPQASWTTRLARRIYGAVREMNYASRRMAEVRVSPELAGDTRDRAADRLVR
ncbi:MAG: hypothetical protein JO242_08745 [Streptosporangiaceae bacterium]|nr:hypothetical protein [Streptosporangiaceae bacterium]